ncbi:MAG: hypothetical protein AB1778_01750 [Candidatus Bipolaricaulota bacterium]
MCRKLGACIVVLLMFLALAGVAALGAGRYEAIAGDYQIDITNLGMPLIFYLRIDADGAFMLAPNTGFDPVESRGEGVLAESGGVYMMIYKEHTSDNPKTATFVLDGPNLVFQSRLPYGASNILNSAEDPDDPTIVYLLTADTLVLAEYFGTYVGSHSTQAMGATVEYVYTLELKAGLRYAFVSEFAMGGTDYSYAENGTWSVADGKLTLDPADEDPVEGTISAEGEITVAIRPSAMAPMRADRILRIATHAEVAGTYVGEKSSPMYTVKSTLDLDMFGNYHYSADVGMPDKYEETGAYDVVDGTVTLAPEGGAAYMAMLANLVVTGRFRIIGSMPATDLVMYSSTIQGTFAGTATNEEIEYTARLTLSPGGTYALQVTDGTEQVIVDSAGSFEMRRGMTLMVVLAGMDPAPTCSVSAEELNLSIVLPGVTVTSGMGGGLGFTLRRE